MKKTDPNKLQVAARLVACAEIDSVRLLEGECATQLNGSSEELKQTPLDLAVEFSTEGSFAPKQLKVIAEFILKATRPDSESQMVVVRSKFEIAYRLPEHVNPSKEEIKAFSETNALLNSWPYWREFVQSSTVRMNLPPLTLPLFRLFRAPEPSEHETGSPEKRSTSAKRRKKT